MKPTIMPSRSVRPLSSASNRPRFPDRTLQYLRPHGTLVAVGLPPDTYIKANVFWTVFKALRIVGSYGTSSSDLFA